MEYVKSHLGGSRGVSAAIAAAAVALIGATALAPQRGPLPFLALIGLMGLAGLAYLIWYTDPVWTLTVAICLSVFGGSWEHLGLPANLPIPPDRLLLLAGVAASLTRAPAAENRPAIRLQPIHGLLAAALLYAAISAAVSGTLLTNDGFFRLFDRFGVAAFGMFLLAPVVFSDLRKRNIFLAGVIVVGAYLGLTALFETVGIDALVFPKYILNPDLGIHADRARGPFLEAEANGIALYFCGVAAMLGFVTWRDRRWVSIGVLVVAVLCAAGCLFTLERAIWVGALAATIVTLVAFHDLRRFVFPTACAVATLAIVTFLFVPGFEVKAEERAEDNHSLWDRTNLNTAAFNMIEARPLFGFGWARFSDASPPYFQQNAGIPLTAVGPQSCSNALRTNVGAPPPCTVIAHNSYLSNGAELGLLGTGLWALSFVLAIGGAILKPGAPKWKPWRAGLLAIAIMWAIVMYFTPLEGPFSPVLLWIWAGLVWAGEVTSVEVV